MDLRSIVGSRRSYGPDVRHVGGLQRRRRPVLRSRALPRLYSSPDGVNWTRLANQPGGAVLSTGACPPQSASNNHGCPIYRGEITSVCALETGARVCNPARNEMYAWYVFAANRHDDGWGHMAEPGRRNFMDRDLRSRHNECGDSEGCGVQQGTYNLELLAVPFGAATNLYAGALNLYKCSISATLNPTCTSSPFMNLTHVYGCVPISAPAHVHPAQHAMAYMISELTAATRETRCSSSPMTAVSTVRWMDLWP